MEAIEKIQYKAALSITGCWRGTNRQKLYEELGWETLSDRRWSHRLFQFFKIINNMTPSYLKNKLPNQRVALRNNEQTRFFDIFFHSFIYMNSFFPDSIKIWNSIGIDFAHLKSYPSFKNRITNLIRPSARSIFGIYDPIGLKFLYQLRVGLSPLKSHKHRHNFQDTPVDLCDCMSAPEDTSHFLLSCELYSAQRLVMKNSISNILDENNLSFLLERDCLYLYGHNSLACNQNKTILLATIKFIKESNRFF